MRHLVPTARASAFLVCALLLTACDSGHRDEPGRDNKSPGPDLRIQVPGRWTKASPKVGSDLKVAFDLRNEKAGQTIQWRLAGSNEIRTIEDPKRAQSVATADEDGKPSLPVGQHLIVAWVVNEDGSYVDNPQSVALSPFYYAPLVQTAVKDDSAEDGIKKDADGNPVMEWAPAPGNPRADLHELGHIDAEGLYARFDERAPAIVAHTATRSGSVIRLPVAVANRSLGDSLRLRATYRGTSGTKEMVFDKAGLLMLSDAAPDAPYVELVLETRDGEGEEATWTALPGKLAKQRVTIESDA